MSEHQHRHFDYISGSKKEECPLCDVTTTLLSTIRERVEGMKILLMTYDLDPETGDYIGKTEGRFLFRDDVLSLLTEIEKEL